MIHHEVELVNWDLVGGWSDGENKESKDPGGYMHCKWHVTGSQKSSTYLERSCRDVRKPDKRILHNEFKKENHPEHFAASNTKGDEDVILFLIDNSAVDHINDVHQHKGVEAQGIFSKPASWCIVRKSKFICNYVDRPRVFGHFISM